MANANLPFGFLPINKNGCAPRVRYYLKTAGAAQFVGDCLTLVAAGTVSIAAAGDVLIGVAAESRASAYASKTAVFDDPDQEFICLTSGAWALADVGLNSNIVATAGDATLDRSKHAWSTALQAATATLQFKCLGLYDRADNVVGSFATIRVKPNHHFFSADVAGI